MIVTTAEMELPRESSFHRSLAVGEVTGGQSTGAWKGSRVGDPEYREALAASLDAAGWLTQPEEARFQLEVELQEQDSLAAGLDIDAWITIRYVVAPTGDGSPVYDHTIKTGFRVPHGVAFSGVEKQKLAFEGAVRDNIARFLAGLGELASGTP
jgi:hypothetical protein